MGKFETILKISVGQHAKTKHGDLIGKFKFVNPLLVKRKAGEGFGVDARICAIEITFGNKVAPFPLDRRSE